MGRRRISHERPVGYLFLVKSHVIVFRSGFNTVMVRMVGLDHSLARPLSSSGPARSLHQQLHRPFPAPEIRLIQGKIRRDYAHQCHIRKIMSFHDHLCSDQDVRLMRGKRRKDRVIASLCTGRIQIHPEDPASRKFL